MGIHLISRSLFLKLGGEEVEYDPGFQLYIQTKLSNPHYKPEIAAQVQKLSGYSTRADELFAARGFDVSCRSQFRAL